MGSGSPAEDQRTRRAKRQTSVPSYPSWSPQCSLCDPTYCRGPRQPVRGGASCHGKCLLRSLREVTSCAPSSTRGATTVEPDRKSERRHSTGTTTAWDPQTTPAGATHAFAFVQGTVLIGCAFQTVRGLRRVRLAQTRGSTGEPLEWSPSVDSTAVTMANQGSVLAVGGLFQNVSGAPRKLWPSTGRPTDQRRRPPVRGALQVAFAERDVGNRHFVCFSMTAAGFRLACPAAARACALLTRVHHSGADSTTATR